MSRRIIIFLCVLVLLAIFVGIMVTKTIKKQEKPTHPFDTPPTHVEPKPKPDPKPNPNNGSGNNSRPQKHPAADLRELEEPQ